MSDGARGVTADPHDRGTGADIDWAGPRSTWLLGLAVTIAVVADSFREKFYRAVTGQDIWISGDFTVYQDGALAYLHQQPFIGEGFASRTGLPFTYPPFAAFVFAPLGVGSTTVMAVLFHALLLGCTATILWALARTEGLGRPWLTALALTGVALLTLPLYRNLHYGQINLVLFVLVVLDLTVVPRRFRGILTGVAAGLKITPIAFAVFFSFRREWFSVARAVATFLATIGLAWMIFPSQSKTFWTSEAWDTSRAGAYNFGDNESITGVLGRAGMSTETVQLVFPWLSAPLIVLTLWVTWSLLRAGRDVAAIGAFATGMVICEPIGWLHHAALAPLALVVCLASPRHRSWTPVLATAYVVLAIGAPLWWDKLDAPMGTAYPLWRQIAYSSPLIVGLVALVAAALWCRGQRSGITEIGAFGEAASCR